MNDRAGMTEALRRFNRIAVPLDGRRAAAVAIAVSDDGFLLTRRTSKLRAHAGQFALPGGRLDPGEDAVDAALRELREEVGASADRGDCLGVLDDYPTRSGYVITPVVVWPQTEPGELSGPASEVTQVFRVPVRDLDVAPQFLETPETDAPVIRLPIFDRFVHAPTAAIIYQFCQVALHGQPVRVAHFDAPVFLWR